MQFKGSPTSGMYRLHRQGGRISQGINQQKQAAMLPASTGYLGLFLNLANGCWNFSGALGSMRNIRRYKPEGRIRHSYR